MTISRNNSLTWVRHFPNFTFHMHKIFPSNKIFFHFILYFFFTAYEIKQPTVQAKLSAMRSQFPQAVAWIDKIPLHKWS